MTLSNKYIVVAALDFGTTFSGYAFSLRHEFDIDPLKISTNPIWRSGHRNLTSYKAPTCLLLDDKKEFLAFGYEAEDLHADKILEGNKDSFYFFHRFKMNLHNNKNITKTMLLEDITGKSVPAVHVFKLSIKALVDHLLKTLKTCGKLIQREDIRYVLTVPAIWTDSAKEFMRTSAEEAGIPKDQLILALEPEAASIYCQYLPTEKLSGSEGFAMSQVGTTYMVVDLGGGTADITVHEKVAGDRLKEKHMATGNNCGGTAVDGEFCKFLGSVIGEDVFPILEKNYPLEYLDLVREFESTKRSIQPTLRSKVTINLPIITLNKVCKKLHGKEFEDVVKTSKHKSEIVVVGEKIRFDLQTGKEMFKPTINNIISKIREILKNPSTGEVSMILMVGGFSECQLVQDAIRETFEGKRVIIPEDSGLSVLKGAVLYGHRPDYIQERVMRCTYGIKTNLPFEERKYDRTRLVRMGNEDKVDNIFSIIVRKDEKIAAGTKVKKSYFTPHENQENMDFEVFCSNGANPSFVDDEGCYLLSKLTIEFSETFIEKRWVDVEYIFGNTEIGLTAKDRNTGHMIKANLNLI